MKGISKSSRAIARFSEKSTTINGRNLHDYFNEKSYIEKILFIINSANSGRFFEIKVRGGGHSSQVKAIINAIVYTLEENCLLSEEAKTKIKNVGLLYIKYLRKERTRPGMDGRVEKPYRRR
jgi:ribosomal protein S9